jgi:predicted alpha/beta hydrolase family esterase
MVHSARLRPDKAGAADQGLGSGPLILIVPGLDNSGPDHWQSHWLRALPNAIWVDQVDWYRPTLGDWVASLVLSIRAHPDAVLVGHSLGCALIAHVAQLRGARGIGGALLVAPADVNREGPAGRLLTGFGPMPVLRLPFPSVVVASRDDPFVKFEQAAAFAHGWGARLVDSGHAGHINIASGHGPWPAGRLLLSQLVDEIASLRTEVAGPERSWAGSQG